MRNIQPKINKAHELLAASNLTEGQQALIASFLPEARTITMADIDWEESIHHGMKVKTTRGREVTMDYMEKGGGFIHCINEQGEEEVFTVFCLQPQL